MHSKYKMENLFMSKHSTLLYVTVQCSTARYVAVKYGAV